MTNIDYNVTRDYFKPTSAAKVATISIIIGVLTIFFAKNPVFLGITMLAFLIGISSIVSLNSKPKLEDVEKQIERVEAKIIRQALDRLGLDIEDCKEIDPILIQYKEYLNSFNNFMYNPKDDMPSNYKFLIIFCTEEQVYYYDYVFSLISNEYSENTGEYFYRDIVALNTQNQKTEFTYEGRNYVRNLQSVSLSTAGGNAFTTAINKDDERAIQGMRQLLREKKKALA